MSCEKGYKGCEERQDEGRTNSSFHVLCNRGTKCHSCLLESTVLSRQCNMVLPSFLVVQTSCGFFLIMSLVLILASLKITAANTLRASDVAILLVNVVIIVWRV